jgi:hypothetical protein
MPKRSWDKFWPTCRGLKVVVFGCVTRMSSNQYQRWTSVGADPVTKFTIWISTEGGRTHVGVYDASNADGAMRNAFDAVAHAWSCDQDVLSIAGIAEGDLDAWNGETCSLSPE